MLRVMIAPEVLHEVCQQLERRGMLLEADRLAPSIAGIVAGGPIRGSWWGHEAGAAIYAACEALDDSADVMRLKLVAGKVTYVHRRLWGQVVAIGMARADWQLERLEESTLELLDMVDVEGTMRVDTLPELAGLDAKARSTAVRAIEDRLLVHSTSIHTTKGRHVKQLMSWSRWRILSEYAAPLPDAQDSIAALETLVAEWDRQFHCKLTLPWQLAGKPQ